MSQKIYVSLSQFAVNGKDPLKLLEESGISFEVNSSGKRLDQQQTIDQLKGFTGVVAGLEPYNAEVLGQLPELKCISRCGVGTDNVDHSVAKDKGITICNTPNVVIQPVAELTIGLIFDVLRRISQHNDLVKAKNWKRIVGNNFFGKRVGILGVGRIGKRVAEMCKALGAKVYGSDLYPDQEWGKENEVEFVSFKELLTSSDILSIHLADNVENPIMLSKDQLLSMKKGAMIINVSRGRYIDEAALYDVLKEEHLSGAGLDVYHEEPYAGKLIECDNVVCTPHIATLTVESRLQMEIEATANLLNYFKDNS